MPNVTVPNLTNGQEYGFRMFPRNLRGQYQTELNGATALGTPQAIPPNLSDATWAQIALASENNLIPATWVVGSEKDITLSTGETLTLVIVGLGHDDLSDGSGKAGITFGLKHLMADKRYMNYASDNSGGFTGSDMYSWMVETLLSSLPADLKASLKQINKKTSAGSNSSTINTNAMGLFLFAEIEIFGSVSYSKPGEGTQYPYFTDQTKRIKRLANGAGDVSAWYGRSPYSSGYFCSVNPSGGAGYTNAGAMNNLGVCFGFCV